MVYKYTKYISTKIFLIFHLAIELGNVTWIFAATNGTSRCLPRVFQVKVLLSDDMMNINNRNRSFSASTVLMELLKNIWQQVRLLASLPLLKYALLCWAIYFANMFGYVSHKSCEARSSVGLIVKFQPLVQLQMHCPAGITGSVYGCRSCSIVSRTTTTCTRIERWPFAS